jgi:uncharacterized protein YggE
MRGSSLLIVAVLALLGGQLAQSADQSRSEAGATIEVSGTGEVIVDPDHATLSLAVETPGATSAAAGADNARLTAAVTGALLEAGATRSDVVTANYTLEPQWQYVANTPPKRTGYQARNTLRVSVAPLSVLGKWIDAALGAGATRVENIEFDSSAAASARRQALSKAVADAKEEAETLARAAGGKLGPLQNLSTVEAGGPRPMERFAVTASLQAGQETHLEPSPLHITATVTGRWLFEP